MNTMSLSKIGDTLRDAQMYIEAGCIDWARLNDGPDHDPEYKPDWPEIVHRCARSRDILEGLIRVHPSLHNKTAPQVYREVVSQLSAYKEKYYPRGAVVSVDCDKFSGAGVSVGRVSDCPPDRLSVRIESGNVLEYPLESCEPFYVGENTAIPEWIKQLSKEPWWLDSLSRTSAQISNEILHKCSKLKVEEKQIQKDIDTAKSKLQEILDGAQL